MLRPVEGGSDEVAEVIADELSNAQQLGRDEVIYGNVHGPVLEIAPIAGVFQRVQQGNRILGVQSVLE